MKINNKTNLVSIIVPVYNVENYLSRCIDSLINQSYQNTEIILVNDGSKDNSPEICKKYAELDNRIKLINKENSGVSLTRNAGIEQATGEYIIFVDSDDYIDLNTISTLITNVNSEIDMVVYGYRKVQDNSEIYSFKLNEETIDIKQIKSNYWRYYLEYTFSPVWGKLYKSSIIKNNNIYFKKGLKTGEDSLYNLSYLYHSKKVKLIDKIFYNYETNQSSAMNGTLPNYFNDAIFLHENIRKFSLSNNSISEKNEKLFESIAIYNIMLAACLHLFRYGYSKQEILKKINLYINHPIIVDGISNFNFKKLSPFMESNDLIRPRKLKYRIIDFLFKHKLKYIIYLVCKIQSKNKKF